MSHFPFAIVGFDLDGTFLDTSGDLTAAVNHALGVAGRPSLDVATVKTMIGGGGKVMLERGLAATGGCDPGQLSPLYDELIAFYEANITVHTRPFPGALDALDALTCIGVKTAIVTNKAERLALRLLTELGLMGRFVTVLGGDTLGPGRAKPAGDLIVEMITRCGGGPAAFVGDSIYDVMAARNAGVPSVVCSFGFLTGPVSDLGADAVIDDYSDLIPTLRSLCAT